jgi:3-hydroxyisobutyrate dehydrogenase-like beta-hydroxyacid dehydrogenase
MDVGFIGLGLLGRAMAGNLMRAGHRVTVHNRTRRRSEEHLPSVDAALMSNEAGEHGE